MRYAFASLIGLASAGWLAPLWFATHCYLRLFADLSDARIRGMAGMDSFPFQSAMSTSLAAGFTWLGLVVFGWTAFLANHYLKRR